MNILETKLLEVKNYDYLVSSFTGADGLEKPFPANYYNNNSVGEIAASGEFLALLTEHDEKSSIYVPYFVGSLKLSVDGVVVYYHDDAILPASVISTNSKIIEIPWTTLNSLTSNDGIFRFTFELTTDRAGLAVLSKMYVGDSSFFQKNQLKNEFHFDTLRTGILGGQISLLLLLVYSMVSRKLGSEAYAPVVILLYFVLVGLGKYTHYSNGFLFLAQIGISLSPLAIAALFKLFFEIKDQILERHFRSAYYWFGAANLLPAVVASIWGFDLAYYNKLVSAPTLIVGIITLSLITLRSYFYSPRLDIGIWAVLSSVACYAVCYEIFFRFGLATIPTNFSAIASMLISIGAGVTFTQLILSKKIDLAITNLEMRKALKHQSQVLEYEFKRTSDLQVKAASREETERLTAELHDGVLTYLSMINSLSDKSTDLALQSINILSRNALNEIRIILEARPSDAHSLTIALSALRAQLVDPLVYIGVEVEWSTHALLDHGAIEPKVLMGIIRIVQEAIHNAVIRAECTFLSIVANRQDNSFSIIVINKGGHSFTEKYRKGLGIASMITRSSSIGATLNIQPIKTGAMLTLTIPDCPFPKRTLQIDKASVQS
jgi:signal transduction histidine kinase